MTEPKPAAILSCPMVMRLAGLWLIWAAWASSTGWLLSAVGALGPKGYILCLPVLFGCCVWWWVHTRHHTPGLFPRPRFPRLGRGTDWQKMAFLLVAVLSLVGALAHVPWSADAVTYRLPRCLYWLAEQRWYWIGTLDGRLDFSSCGMEWQMIPLLLLTGTDRFLFLLSFVPFLLLPGLFYVGGRALGLARRPLTVWMWLLPCAYSTALQSGGLQNDGYAASYTAACLGFGGIAIRRGSIAACLMCGIAAALLSGAKLSNLPLLLPLGIMFITAGLKCGFFRRAAVVSLPMMALLTFLPHALLAYKHTSHWTGDPHDQWGVRTGNPIAATAANAILAANDLVHPPVMLGTDAVNATTDKMEDAAGSAMRWMTEAHKLFAGVRFGDMVYEGEAGPGFSIGVFLIGGSLAGYFLRCSSRPAANPHLLGFMVLGGGVVAWLVFLGQLGSGHSARISAPYLPLLVFAASGIPSFRRFLFSRYARPLALLGMLSVLPVQILTPLRPLMPISLLERMETMGPVSKILAKYRIWEAFRDDLKPMRDRLPPDLTVIGYAGAFQDTSYGLWKPFGTRVIKELGVPVGNPAWHATVPDYVVATERGIMQRFGISLDQWTLKEGKEVRFSFRRRTSLESDKEESEDEWFLLGPR